MEILIADDHRIMRDSLQTTLEGAGFAVVGGAANGREAIALAQNLQPDLVVMDISMPEVDGIEATHVLNSTLPQVKVVALSMKSDRFSVLAMFAAGARGYLAKGTASKQELLQAIAAVAEGHKYVSPAVASLVLDGAAERVGGGQQRAGAVGGASRESRLSSRERQVLRLLAEGKSSKEIATYLELSVPTVETHRRQIGSKVGLRSIAELTKYAVREGLTPLD